MRACALSVWLQERIWWYFSLPQSLQVYLVFASIDDLPDSFASFSRNNWKLVKEAEADLAGTDSYKCRTGK